MYEITDDSLRHYGVSIDDGAPGRGSGRYPKGSGQKPYQHPQDFLDRVNRLRSEGLSEREIARETKLHNTSELRVLESLAKDEVKSAEIAKIQKMRDEGMTPTQIAKELGYANESSIRSKLETADKGSLGKARVTADYLKELVDEKGFIDVSTGADRDLNVSREKLNQALYLLELEGYPSYTRGVAQVTNKGQQTNTKILCPPGTEYKDIYQIDLRNVHNVKSGDKLLTDDGDAVRPAFVYPASMDSKRLAIRYAEDGGINKDGVIELRRGVKDLSLGEAHYAQVRILVDGTHYLKGMAIYSDDLPPGVDVMFNTNKKQGTPALGPKDNTVLKRITSDPDNPFGSLIKEHGGQSYFIGDDGEEHLSLINKRAEEGDWRDWSDKVPSQFLSKQSKSLIQRQLSLTEADKQDEYDSICALTNPTVKRSLLMSFADDCDSAAVHLKAAAFPRQKYQVMLPLTTIKDNEVYAPNYENGEQLALIRYPHGGTFEIPILTVNNKQAEGRRVLGPNTLDAVGVNAKVAERLSGADFDGDTVMVIPTKTTPVTSHKPLQGLKDFDPKMKYGYDEAKTDADGKTHYYRNGNEFRVMTNTQKEMGMVSNLITDMTIKGAGEDKIAAAVRHSMVVIDAEKHKLDYKQSEKDNHIPELKREYMGHITEKGTYSEGASTLISAAKSEYSVTKRQGSPRINEKGRPWYDPSRPEGALVYKTADDVTYIDPKTGKTKTRMQKSTRMGETDDAFTLVSEFKSPQEIAYATFANKMKDLANSARLEASATGNLKYSPSAHDTYKMEVQSLEAKLAVSLDNVPREREAQRIANSVVSAKRAAYEEAGLTRKEMNEELKKESQRALAAARTQVGAHRTPIDISEREWEAIQNGAISDNKLSMILRYADLDKVREMAMPRGDRTLSEVKQSRIRSLSNSGYTNEEIAKAVGVSVTTVQKYL